MKATVWLWPIMTLICFSPFVYTSAQQEYQEFPSDSNLIQDDYMLEKRTKPSLSIVNPLDVLRQRLLLEIARRQMKENTRQVEINRAILKNVGKRGNHNQQDLQPVEQQLDQQQFHQSDLHQFNHFQMNPNSFYEFLRREEANNNNNINNINNKKLKDADFNLAAGAGTGGAVLATGGDGDDDYQMRYLYRLHKNRFSK